MQSELNTSAAREWGQTENVGENETIRPVGLYVKNSEGGITENFLMDDDIYIKIIYQVFTSNQPVSPVIRLTNEEGTTVFTSFDNQVEDYARCKEPGTYQTEVKIPKFLLNEGYYRVLLSINVGLPLTAHFYEPDAVAFQVSEDNNANFLRSYYGGSNSWNNPSGLNLEDNRAAIIRDKVAVSHTKSQIRINLGAGDTKLDGFLSVDIDPRVLPDVVSTIDKLPFKTGTIAEISAYHVIEHVYYWEAEITLREWFRVLEPGGKIVIECPDLEKITKYLTKEKDFTKWSSLGAWGLYGDPNHRNIYYGHHWGYTPETLSSMLTRNGFTHIISSRPQTHVPSRDMRLEAEKPLVFYIHSGRIARASKQPRASSGYSMVDIG